MDTTIQSTVKTIQISDEYEMWWILFFRMSRSVNSTCMNMLANSILFDITIIKQHNRHKLWTYFWLVSWWSKKFVKIRKFHMKF